MRLEQLYYLSVVAKSKSLSLASEQLYITQQSLGKSIRDLEAELGTQLLERSNKGINLTTNGHEAALIAENILAQLDDFKHHFEQVPAQPLDLQGNLYILGCQAIYSLAIPALIKSFKQKHHNTSIRTMEYDGYYIPALHLDFIKKYPNFSIVSIINVPEPSIYDKFTLPTDLEFYPLLKNKFMACVSKKSTLAKLKKISIKTLLKSPIIIQSPEFENKGIDYLILEKYGTPHIGMVVDNADLFCQAIEDNLGVAITPTPYALSDRLSQSSEMVFIELKENTNAMLGYVLQKDAPVTPLITEFIAILKTILKAQ